MILPQPFLDTISFYEHRVDEGLSNGFSSVFILHFKSAWKCPKKIKMPWRLIGISGDLQNYEEPNGSAMLRQQLYTYFKEPTL